MNQTPGNFPNMLASAKQVTAAIGNATPNTMPSTTAPIIQASPVSVPTPTIEGQMPSISSDSLSIFGKSIPKKYIYIIGVILLIVIGYFAWSFFMKKGSKSKDNKENDSESESNDENESQYDEQQQQQYPPGYGLPNYIPHGQQ